MDTQTLITAREFEKAAARLGPCELIRGEVVTLSPGGIRHSQTAMNAGLLVAKWNRRAGLGRVLGCEVGLITKRDPDTVRGADVAYYSYQRLPKEVQGDSFCAVPPELVVEIVGKGQGWREMVTKAAEYLHMGVDRVWIIEPRSARLHIYRSDSEPVVLQRGDTLTEPLLPGFSCRVDDFFAD
jgi:Uma2 family endonuclease